MTGQVRNLHALMPVTFRIPGQPDFSIEFVVDTGFTGLLTLPPHAVAAMNLSYLYDYPSQLADGSMIAVPLYEATILWKGIEMDVRILAMGNRPLLGTALLDGQELVAQFVDNGLVTIEDV